MSFLGVICWVLSALLIFIVGYASGRESMKDETPQKQAELMAIEVPGIRGPVGPMGPRGDIGPQGIQGETGGVSHEMQERIVSLEDRMKRVERKAGMNT